MDLLVLADPTGIVDMTPEAIARRTNVPADVIMSALSALERPDVRSRSETDDGRRIVRLSDHRDWGWQIVNFEHYHKMRNENARREANKIYQRESRARRKVVSADVSRCQQPSALSAHVDVDVDVDADTDAKNSTVRKNPHGAGSEPLSTPPPGFVRFWSAWPKHTRKVGKAACLAIWRKDTLEANADQVIAVLEAMKTCQQWTKDGGEFIPLPKTWLNQKRWDADIADIETVTGEPPGLTPEEMRAATAKGAAQAAEWLRLRGRT